jgi:hypothetical protein
MRLFLTAPLRSLAEPRIIAASEVYLMRILRFSFALGPLLATLCACGGGMPGSTSAGSFDAARLQAETLTAAQATARGLAMLHTPGMAGRQRSWMAKGAASSALLYISGEATNAVYVYTYPKPTLVGTLTGFNAPSGECSGKDGSVYVLNGGGNTVDVYTHGGTTPVETLDLPGYPGLGCSVDPKTGDFAVGSFYDDSCTECAGYIVVFRKGSDTPITYQPTGIIAEPPGCAYDNDGNLFCDAYSHIDYKFSLFELPKGGKSLIPISVNSSTLKSGPMQWDGEYLAIGSGAVGTIYQVAVSGSAGTVAGTTTLNDTGWVWQSWITGIKKGQQGTRIIAPTYPSSTAFAGYWDYPAGGNPTETISLPSYSQPDGVTLSKQ